MSQVYKRITFTQMVAGLIRYAYSMGHDVILDWALRDAVAQNSLFKQGSSKCDGYDKKSQHQKGLAIDLYIIEDSRIVDDVEKYKILHEYWEQIGGEKEIAWDAGHFEMK